MNKDMSNGLSLCHNRMWKSQETLMSPKFFFLFRKFGVHYLCDTHTGHYQTKHSREKYLQECSHTYPSSSSSIQKLCYVSYQARDENGRKSTR